MLRGAVEAWLGITCRTEAGLGLVPSPDYALPLLPKIAYFIVERRQGDGGSNLATARMRTYLEGREI